jgi:hypothetical protein
MNYTPMVDDTKSGILKHEADEAYRRLQQGFEALRPAFSCNRKVHTWKIRPCHEPEKAMLAFSENEMQ